MKTGWESLWSRFLHYGYKSPWKTADDFEGRLPLEILNIMISYADFTTAGREHLTETYMGVTPLENHLFGLTTLFGGLNTTHHNFLRKIW